MDNAQRITEPSPQAPDITGLNQAQACARYRSHGWLYLFDAPVSGPMTLEEFQKIPESQRAVRQDA